ncbi:TetR/AcrR family transcriptional regulator [Chitinophaga vietnamensis]|uniref:TetR/AcrR family transcriptional regulator n=1 Tax=Chitinophaga vietnamensis TaxID=2593957 RepID=UPI001178C445|nr:TetR/AcrR family transcriptional regulator [Chitinophaga vietnamensis]
MKAKAHPKDRILETAARLFYEQGYQATGINQLIDEAGVAKASLYQYFESKEALCAAFLQQRHAQWFAGLRAFTEKPRKPKAKVLAAFDFLHHMNEQENYRGCAFLNVLSEITEKEDSLLQIIRQHKQELKDYLAALLAGQKPSLKDHVYLLFEAALVESQVFRQQWPVTEAKKVVAGLLA